MIGVSAVHGIKYVFVAIALVGSTVCGGWQPRTQRALWHVSMNGRHLLIEGGSELTSKTIYAALTSDDWRPLARPPRIA